MIRPLRSRHRFMIVAVGAIAGTVFVAGLAARRPAPRVDSLRGLELVFERGTAAGRVVGDRLLLDPLAPNGPGRLGVYWAPRPGAGLGDSFWLGGLGAQRRAYRLPGGADPAAGEIVLYAFDRREVVDRGRAR